ncbi:MAG: hypothetical protein PHS47_06120 [Methanocellales archaeon]|nr:hypothetical protein [Methanocellales archaeon]MDD4898950.1 hypothetical protein [Methanocellales archaeon]
MKKVHLGLTLGIVAGIIDVIPMIIQKLTWDANLSAFFLWIVSGFLIATSEIKIKGALKGMIISFLVLLPSAILIGWKEPFSLIPIFIMTLILGSGLGFLIDRYPVVS